MGPEHPEALDNINALKVSDELRDFVSALDKDIQESRTDRADWENRQDEYTRKRYGIRTKKTFPWVGAANFVLPQIDSDINRLKPAYVNLAQVIPIVTFEPFGPEDVDPARKREYLFDWRMRNEVKFQKEYLLGVDYALQRGFTLFKITWKFQTRKYTKYLDLSELDQEVLEAIFMPEVTDEILFQIIAESLKPDLTFEENVKSIQDAIAEFREGKTKFEFEFVEKAENRPEVKACDPRQDVTFPVGTTDIQNAHFIDYRYWVSKNDVKIAMQDEKFEKFDDDEIDSWGTRSYQLTTADHLKSIRDGVTTQKRHDDLILLHEVCTWYDINGDGINERVIITYPDTNPSAVLRFIEVPYDHGMFPYVVVRREINDAEIMASRGIPAIDDDFQTGISTLFNQDIDSGTISTTPTVVARKNSVKNLRNLRYVPGQVVETENGTGDYQVVQNQNLGQGGRFNSMQYLKAWANDRIGNLTAAISQSNNMPGAGQKGEKTAREVATIESSSTQLQAMDLFVWQLQMADVYYQIDALYEQFGDEDQMIMMTGQKPERISRQEIQGRFNMVPNGRLDNSNPGLRAQKIFGLLQLFINDPDFKGSELKKIYVNEIDPRLAGRIMLTEEEKAMQAQMMAQQQAVMEASELQKQLGVRKISDSLELEKEQKLAIIQGKKYADG